MIQQGRNEAGKFASKSDEIRHVRSIRLTNTAWDVLGKIADSRSITRADLVENWMGGEYFDLENKAFQLELELQNLKNTSLQLSQTTLDNLIKVADKRGITREELIINLLDSCTSHNLVVEPLEHTQLDLLSESKNEFNVNISPLNNNKLAQRFGVDPSNLKKQMMKGEDRFLIYSASKDPDRLGWKYSQHEKLYYPVFN